MFCVSDANLLKIVTPRILLSASTLAWGVLTIGTAFVKNFHDLIAVRVLLGVAEAGESRGSSLLGGTSRSFDRRRRRIISLCKHVSCHVVPTRRACPTPVLHIYSRCIVRSLRYSNSLCSILFTANRRSTSGGLLAYGLTQIKTGSLVGWQYLYVVEGAISMAFAPIAFLIIPNTLTKVCYAFLLCTGMANFTS